jgi:hypothetical protein
MANMPHPANQTCANCLYFEPGYDRDVGRCLRLSPGSRLQPEDVEGNEDDERNERYGLDILTADSEWCGEWAPAPVNNEAGQP